MTDNSAIQWTGSTVNPFRAINRVDGHKRYGQPGWFCVHASDGCRNCYAETDNHRFGTQVPFKPGHLANGEVELFLDEKMLLKPLRRTTPTIWFPFSMTDWAADFYPDEWLDKWFAVMAMAPHHTFQMLTKRADRMRTYLNAAGRRDAVIAQMHVLGTTFTAISWPLPNVWMGVSVENHANIGRLDDLAQTKAALRWISYEPAIGRADFSEAFGVWWNATSRKWVASLKPPFDWIVVGGESGSDRVFHTEWALSVIEVGAAAEVKVFVKQLGATVMHQGKPLRLVHPKGGDMDEWPKELRVRQMPAGLAVPVKTKKEARA